MLTPTKRLILTAIFAIMIFSPVFALDADVTPPKLKFVNKEQEQPWIKGIRLVSAGPDAPYVKEYGEGVIEPTHMAELFVWTVIGDPGGGTGGGRVVPRRVTPQIPIQSGLPRLNDNYPGILNRSDIQWRSAILATTAGKSLSQRQKELLTTGNTICRIGMYGEKVGNHSQFALYAVSEEDARKMSNAFVEGLYGLVQENLALLNDYQKDVVSQIEQSKKELAAKEEELQQATEKFEKIKSEVNFSNTKEADVKIAKLNNTLASLEITIAGHKAKVAAIQDYLTNKKISNPATIAKLEDKLGTCAIELADTLAQKEAIITLRDRAQLYRQVRQLPFDINHLREELAESEGELQAIGSEMNGPSMQPPQIFQNTVTIYPVDPDLRDDSSGTGSYPAPPNSEENNSPS